MKYYKSSILSRDYYIIRGNFMLNVFFNDTTVNYGLRYSIPFTSNLVEITKEEFDRVWEEQIVRIKNERIRNTIVSLYEILSK